MNKESKIGKGLLIMGISGWILIIVLMAIYFNAEKTNDTEDVIQNVSNNSQEKEGVYKELNPDGSLSNETYVLKNDSYIEINITG